LSAFAAAFDTFKGDKFIIHDAPSFKGFGLKNQALWRVFAKSIMISMVYKIIAKKSLLKQLRLLL
jgi:hypothetical protein